MTCPECQGKTAVLETRDSPHGTRRRRHCRACGHRFTTFEAPVVRIVAQRARPAADTPDAGDIAHEVIDALETEFGARLDELPDAVVDAILAEAEARSELSNGYRPELMAGEENE